MRSALTILVTSRLAGCRTLTDLRKFGRALGKETLAPVGSRPHPQTKLRKDPGVRIRPYILQRIDAEEVERLLAA